MDRLARAMGVGALIWGGFELVAMGLEKLMASREPCAFCGDLAWTTVTCPVCRREPFGEPPKLSPVDPHATPDLRTPVSAKS